MERIGEVQRLLRTRETELHQRLGQLKSLAQRGKEIQTEIQNLEKVEQACEEASTFLTSFADQRQEEVQAQVEGLVNQGIRTIFGEDMTFKINTEHKASRSEVSFTLISDMEGEQIETSILDARGGGVAAVIGSLLRIVLTMLTGDRALLVLDETWAQLSVDYEAGVAQFIRELVDETGLQVLLVTHSDSYAEFADTVYQVSQINGVTKIEPADTACTH